jgi:dynein heavy chain, axonemal
MAELLEKTQSSYYPAFKDLYKQTVSAFEEAEDIDIHLKPLMGYFESIESSDFEDIIPVFRPMFQNICFVWANSKYYCRPARIVVLLQEINNSIMTRANEYLNPLDLFKSEIDESVEKIRTTFNTLNAYTKTYNEFKGKIGSYFKNSKKLKLWEFSPNLVFGRWDKFVERIIMIRVCIF